jgi:RNA polymerase sigma factor (sigma-70 family)
MAGTRDGGDPAGRDAALTATGDTLAAVFREESGRLTASVMRVLGDFDAAEEVVQDALLAAWQQWPAGGLPERPGAWLRTVARRRAIDILRRDLRNSERAALLPRLADQADGDLEDDRLMLLFTCCHQALSPEAQVALTLRTVCGLTTAEIARAFLVSEPAVVQRLTRARRKIAAAGVPYRVPGDDELGQRLAGVLAVIYLLFNEGYLCSAGDRTQRRDLTEDAEWLAALLATLMPTEPEVLGLLALIRLHRARVLARFDGEGYLVLLRDQDRSRWDHAAIAAAADLIVRAARLRRPGPYQIQAAIVACHAEAPSWAGTDWLQITLLYDALLEHLPSPVTRLHRAIALSHVLGPQAALDEVESLAADLDRYHLGHATRAELLRQLGRPDLARHADERALSLTANRAERALLEQRLAREAPRCRLTADRPPLKTAKGTTPMATAEEGLQAQIRNIEATYGKTMSEWHAIVAASGVTKHTDVVSMLKSDYGMTHGAAHRVSVVARERANPAVGSAPDADPASALYAGKKAALRPLHDALINVVMAFGDDIGLAPKKGYLSLRRRKQFAMIQPSGAGRIDVGLILPDLPAGQRLEPAAGFNALFTHRVRLSSASDIDTELTGWLRQAYDRAR